MRIGSTTKIPRSVRRAAMDCLARREHSSLELKQKLRQKCPTASEREIDNTISDLQAENLQNDDRFVDSYVRYRQSRGYGYLHIKLDLKQRGISDSLIARHLRSDDQQWSRTLGELLMRRLPAEGAGIQYGDPRHQRIVRFLAGRGFRDREIQQALEQRIRRS